MAFWGVCEVGTQGPRKLFLSLREAVGQCAGRDEANSSPMHYSHCKRRGCHAALAMTWFLNGNPHSPIKCRRNKSGFSKKDLVRVKCSVCW